MWESSLILRGLKNVATFDFMRRDRKTGATEITFTAVLDWQGGLL